MQYRLKWSKHIQDIWVSSNSTKAIIFQLDSATNYSIEVAAMNSAGSGKYSVAIIVTTKGMIFYLSLLLH